MKLSSILRSLFQSHFGLGSVPRQSRRRSIGRTEVCETRILLAAADLDTSFDNDGKVFLETADTRDDEIAKILVRPDGRIVTIGSVNRLNGDYDFVVYQRHSNGAPDLSFGTNGSRYIAFDNGGSNADFAYGAVLQSDGKLVVVGSTELAGGGTSVAVARLTVSGNLDTEFGPSNNGKRTVSVNSVDHKDYGRDVLIRPSDGRIIIVGDSTTPANTERLFVTTLSSSGAIIVTGEYYPSGTTGDDRTFDAEMQADGKVVVTGYSYGTAFEAWVVRLQPDGESFKLDTSFSGDGRMQLRKSFFSDLGADSRALALQPDGKIVIAGIAVRTNTSDPRTHMLIARIKTDGTLDSDFAVSGTRQVAFDSSVSGSSRVDNWATSVFVQPDGKIVAGGVFRKKDGNEDFAVVRLLSNGDSDVFFYPTLGTGRRYFGVDLVSGSGGDDRLTSMALAPDGKIYLAGNAAGAVGDQSVIMRLQGDPNFAPQGIELSNSTIDENLPAPAVVGTFTSSDQAETGTHKYQLVSGDGATDNASFLIDGNTLATTSVFDFESKSLYSIRVRTTDPYGLFYERSFEIRVRNVLDATTGSDLYTMTYSSNSVAITLSTDGGPAVDQGTFSFQAPIFFEGLTSNDTVRVVGSGADDVFERYNISHTVNGSGLAVTGAARVILVGGAGHDTYRFPLDAAPPTPVTTTLDETGGGIDTLDFSGQPVAVNVNLGLATPQSVNAGISLNLQSASAFENVIGTGFGDTLTGNSLGNTLTGLAGDDSLDGAAGSDLLIGGANNDTYLFKTATIAEADQVTENANEGTDTLSFAFLTTSVVAPSRIKFGSAGAYESHVETQFRDLSLRTSLVAAVRTHCSANSLNNTLTVVPENDKLLGAAGNDLLFGGANNDTYMFVPATAAEADQVSENLNQGIDTLNFGYLTTEVMVNLGSNSIQQVHTNRTLKLNSGVLRESRSVAPVLTRCSGTALNNTLTAVPGTTSFLVLVAMTSCMAEPITTPTCLFLPPPLKRIR
jgi:uncharacterized delta-60 repeat protein